MQDFNHLFSKVQVNKPNFSISLQDKILFMGSCFANNLYLYLNKYGLLLKQSPFGIIYNPCSLTILLEKLITVEKYNLNDLYQKQNQSFVSFDHHSSYSGYNLHQVLSNINNNFQDIASFLKHQVNILVITLGTAFYYSLVNNYNRTTIVNNCHQLPNHFFTRNPINVEIMSSKFVEIIRKIKEFRPTLKVIFSISPIRYLRSNATENSLSKALLRCMIENIVLNEPNIYYFPAYEIMLDELRDYRFYQADLIHPNQTAIDIIMQRFTNTFLSSSDQKFLLKMNKILKEINHQPFNKQSQEYLNHLLKLKNKLNKVKQEKDFLQLNHYLNQINKSLKEINN